MADKLNDFMKNMNKGGAPGAPKGLGLLAKLGGLVAVAGYGLMNSVYTGIT